MQKAVKRFLAQTQILHHHSADSAARIVLDFWAAIVFVLQAEWNNPRRSLVTKGIGVYSLMEIAGDLYKEDITQNPDKQYFTNKLSEFITDIDWTTKGTLSGLGGEAGAKHIVSLLRSARQKCPLRIISNAK
jgi:hypothetical protein